MPYDPIDPVNQALDHIGSPLVLGSIYDGDDTAETARRQYGPALRGLLRSSHWGFARKRAELQLLGNSTGQTPGVGTIVEAPWQYVYAWPTDGVCARWLPWSGLTPANLALAGGPPIPGNIQVPYPTVPIMGGLNVGQIPLYPFEKPARFLLSNTDQYPTQTQPLSTPSFEHIEGVGPIHRRIVLTNVPHAQFVYTYLALELEVWDDLFRQAFVAVMASHLAMIAALPESKDTPQLRIAERNAQITIAKDLIRQARVSSDNEAGFRQSTDQYPDWLRVRRFGGFGRWGASGFGDSGAGPGVTWCGWGEMGYSDGSVY